MSEPLQPQNERELMFALSGKIDLHTQRMDNFGEAIDKLCKTIESLEVNRVSALEKSVNDLKNDVSEAKGGIKTIGILVGIGTLISLIVSILSYKNG